MHSLVKALKALADDTRLRIVNILAERECCVCEVSQTLNISQTRASRNLTMLYDTGFLKLRKAGLWSYYSLNTVEMEKYLGQLVKAVHVALVDDKTAGQDRERLKTASRASTTCQP